MSHVNLVDLGSHLFVCLCSKLTWRQLLVLLRCSFYISLYVDVLRLALQFLDFSSVINFLDFRLKHFFPKYLSLN